MCQKGKQCVRKENNLLKRKPNVLKKQRVRMENNVLQRKTIC